jgi:hypothetical protein
MFVTSHHYDYYDGQTRLLFTAEIETQLLSRPRSEFYLVFTPQCLSMPMTPPCYPDSVGETCVIRTDGPSFTPQGDKVYWSLGKRITDTINPSLPLQIEDILQTEYDTYQQLAIERLLPVADVKIYCPPCACAIRTALRIFEITPRN